MRRMDYDRFAKPTNFGEWDAENTQFVLDKELDEGFYSGVIKFPSGAGFFYIDTFTISISDRKSYSSAFISPDNANIEFVVYDSNDKKHLKLFDADAAPTEHGDGLIIEIYKLD